MIKELMDFYEPEKIVHRDKQIKKIKKVFDNFKKFGLAENILCQGVSGSGKTLVIKNIISKENKEDYVFVSGGKKTTTFKILKTIFDLNYNTEERILSEGIEQLKKKSKIIIIDEVYKIRDIKFFFDDLNTIYRETACPIILFSNEIELIDKMPDDARLTLFFKRNVFTSYNATELKDILKERLKLIDIKNMKIPDSALNLICAVVTKGGDCSARMTLTLLRECILKNKFSKEDILKFKEEITDQDLGLWISGLNPLEQKFLKAILDLQSTREEITSPEILQKIGGIHLPKVSNLITIFEGYGILKTEYKNLGQRGGRRRIIKFSSIEMFKKLDKLVPI